MIEGGDLLDGHLLARRLVNGGAGRAVSNMPSIIWRKSRKETYQTTPYAPSPTTSWMSYCSLTLKEILRDPVGLGGFDRDMVALDVVEERLRNKKSL